jgi:hypothetical protein
MNISKEAAETMRDFLGQFDHKDPNTQVVLNLLFEVIYARRNKTLPIHGTARQEGHTPPGYIPGSTSDQQSPQP